MLSESNGKVPDVANWRIGMLARSSGFPFEIGADDFGLKFSGPALNGQWASFRCVTPDVLAMRVPPLVAQEMRKELALGAVGYDVTSDGVVVFSSLGEHADQPIKRASALMRALPNTPLTLYLNKTAAMPATTEVERLAKQRVGQDIFRGSLEDYWRGFCPVTGIVDRALLRASHIKGWAECASDEDRLDVFNGILLAVHLDAAFDAALMTFSETGEMIFSPRLTTQAVELLKSFAHPRISLNDRHQKYLEHHRAKFDAVAVSATNIS
jgi:hypothetical protein